MLYTTVEISHLRLLQRSSIKCLYCQCIFRLELSRISDFRHVPRDLLRLCPREEFDSPVARLGFETRRRSRHPLRLVHHLGCAKRIAIFRGYGEYSYDDADVKSAED
ncbi:hypothetical protein BJ546DRAFT_106518 [Cryomyces antarcticus]